MKLLLLLAVAANAILIVSSDDSESSSSTFSSSDSSTSSSSSSASTEDDYSEDELICGDNERYVDCTDELCKPETCDDLGFPLPYLNDRSDGEDCRRKPNCVCINGYVRSSQNICIPREECPSCGGDPNAVSGCGKNCGRLCSNYYKTNISCTLECQINGCDCKENFVYDEKKGKCVLPEECTNSCTKANEVFDPCPAPCPFRTCGIDDRVISCVPGPKVGDPNCPAPVCRCRDGFYRNGDGECVTWEECPTCSKPNEVYDICPAPCPPRRCDVNEALILCIVPPKPGDPECEPGCRCADGYVKNAHDICIPKDKCPKCTNPNEVFDACPNPCPPRRCDVDERTIRCKAPPKLGDPECEPRCTCVDGYVRNNTGICVTRDECPKCTRPNETFHPCPPTCPPQTCDSLTRKIKCPVPYGHNGRNQVSQRCYPSCICQPGYYRNKIGECISKKDCLSCTGPHEYFSCGSACDNVCATLHSQNQTNCPIKNIDCERKCYCEKGYARDRYNICIPIKQCPVSCAGDPNALPGCGVNCGRLCDNYFKKNVVCPAVCYDDGCDCREGYVFDRNIKRCVRPEDCTPICGRDEIFSNCINGGCDAKYCSQLGKPVPCIRPKYCIQGCLCKKGYLRARNGICVPENKCPQASICGKHEIYEECPPLLCQALNCNELGYPIPCPEISDPECPFDPACICEQGYLRNHDGVCIPEKQCPSCGGDPNAEAGCGVNCGRLCSNYKEESVSCIQACFPNACDCKIGYVLDENKRKCVLPEHCSPQCGPNEQYEECPSSSCRARSCSQLGYPLHCSVPSNCTEEPACVCKDGYLRNDDGVCVLQNECLSCGGDPNARPGCGGYCGRRCSTYNKGVIACPAICYLNSCDCKEGYIYDDNLRKCVRPEECTPVCDKDEVYSDCTNGGCQAKNCTQLGKPIPCIKMNPKFCKKGCLCKEGYLRHQNGTCVPEDKCSLPQCDKDEVYSDCINGGCLAKNCSQKGKPIRCPKIDPKYCIEGCLCKEGYLRLNNGTCVPEEDCPLLQCGKNEIYKECPALSCKPLNCSQLGYPVPCPFIPDNIQCTSEPACICKDGYLRNNIGICVPENQCPSCGGDPNAQPGCGMNCGRKCSNYNNRLVACAQVCKLNGCDCKKGYVYDDNIQACVLPEQCTPVCGNYEIYSSCIQGECRPQSCLQLGQSIPCPRIDPKYCKKGCLCKEGYLRDKNGTCIPEQKCSSPCSKPHEIYDQCPSICPPQTCEAIGKVYPCPLTPSGAAYCKPDCRCEDGYYRNKDNECISKDDCLKCTGLHEFYSCGSACDNECSKIHKQNRTNCPIINKTCNKKCYCEDGYARDKNGICIPIDECIAPQCGKNEVYEECPSSLCQPQKCSQLGYPLNCTEISDPDSCPEDPACICKDGYVRNKKGNCIPKKKCYSCGGDPNAVSGCGVNCNKHCYDFYGKSRGCKKICRVNACDCKEGYYYDDNTGECVIPQRCTPVCDENEVYSTCIQGECRPQNCTQLGQSVSCPRMDPKYCKQGCLCKQGYLKSENGTCIPEKECPSPCKAPHEVYDPCPNPCPPQTCDALINPPPCPAPLPDASYCRGNCQCDDGYLRNKIGECISKDDCLKCTKPHEFFSCGSACDSECSEIYKQNRTNCPIVNIVCNKKCYCEDGYARDKNKTCIPIDKCPVPQCGKNEVYEKCPPSLCQPQYCSELGYPIECPDIPDPDSCPEEPACICKDGYVRNKKGKCIPKKQCPSCKGDRNAESGCGVNCLKHCSDLIKPRGCPRICYPNACDCKDGFYYDDNTDECVLAEECTPTCGNDEVYDPCVNGGCDMKNCSQLGRPTLCIDPLYCKAGCTCKQGYLRADNGTCVPENQCYELQCDEDERFVSCPSALCQSQNCSQLGYPIACAIISENDTCPDKPACICKNEYVRDDDGKCIPQQQCPSCGGDSNATAGCGVYCGQRCSNLLKKPGPCIYICYPNSCDCKQGYYLHESTKTCVLPEDCPSPCGKNERYESCPSALCQPQNCSQLGYSIPCPVISENGTCPDEPACVCIDGYVRNSEGECIPQDKCPSCGGDPNAKAGCGVNCNKRCSNLDKEPVSCIEVCYPNSCDCNEDYYYDDNTKKCVYREDCTPQCGENERYEECPDNLCQPQNCSQVGYPISCPSVDSGSCSGKPACVCEFGYVRSKEGKCIPTSECHNLCQPQNCSQVGYPISCPSVDSGSCSGKPACVCEFGYVRSKEGKCIPTSECPSCGGDPHAKGGCGVNCNRHCYDLNKEPGACILLCYENGCDCDEGYYYDDNIDSCVRPEKCTPTCGDNEVFSECINGGCDMKNCSQLGKPTLCINPLKCTAGCLCKDGYLRADNGTCVPEDQCAPLCTNPNEVYDPCPPTCPPQTCDSINQRYHCPLMLVNKTDEDCLGNCRCKPGYYRNKIGECISKKDCLTCTGPNEYFSCGSACDNECTTLYKQSQTNCPIKNIMCNRKCYCEEGYARNDNKTCIPIEQCPELQCGEYERYEECPSSLRTPQYCSELGNPISCRKSDCDDEEPGCVCIDGYVRNKKNKCIPAKQCPSCGGDPNAEAGCGINCNKHCADYNQEPGVCIELCKSNACDCKDGYYYDDNIDECVLPKHCTPVCRENEVYDICVNGGCDMNNCSQLGEPTLCIYPENCEDGCLCKSGYLRDDDGICVPEGDCNLCPENTTTTLAPTTPSTTTPPPTTTTAPEPDDGNALERLDSGCASFTANFAYQKLLLNPGKSFVASPFSVLLLLGQIGYFSENTTLHQILAVLNLKSIKEILTAFSLLIQTYQDQTSVTFEVATMCYVSEKYPLIDSFDRISKYFDSGSQNIDFGQPQQAANIINKWVEEKTHDKINNLVSPSMFNSNTRLAMLSAVYFLGNWEKQFNVNSTKTKDFYVNKNETIQISMMHLNSRFGYAEDDDLNSQILELPYKGRNFSCIIFLPREIDGLEPLLEKLSKNNTYYNNAIKNLINEDVIVDVPRFEMESDIDVTEIFKLTKLGQLLNTSSDDINILKIREPLHVSDAKQKAYMKFNEVGTEAAAATAITFGATAAIFIPKKYNFNANRPFLIYITREKNPLFCGVFTGVK